jgi:hypothetical protein
MTKLLFIFLFFFSSCSLIVGNFEQDILEKNDITPLEPTSKTYCKKPSSFSLVSESKSSQNSFKRFLGSTKQDFTFVESAVLWSLLQVNLRPDLSSPTSKLQIMLFHRGKEFYLNTYSEKDNYYPYFKALDSLLKEFRSQKSLLTLARYLDQEFSDPLLVSKEFESFLSSNKTIISNHQKLRRAFIRGDETLQTGESLPRVNFQKMIKKYKRTNEKKKYLTSNFLFNKESINQPKSSCNFDLDLYSDSIFLINSDITRANTFGLKKGKSVFLATSSQKINFKSPNGLQFTINGNSNTRAPAMCSFTKDKNRTWLVSSQSRDPGQHIYHIMEYSLPKANDIEELNELLKFSRHLFLKSPVRLVIESRRSSKQQLAELLKLNIPIYNSKKLGKIWGYHSNPKNSTFIIDDRRVGSLTCK